MSRKFCCVLFFLGINVVFATQEEGEEYMLSEQYDKAFGILKPRADKGERRAQYIVGLTYTFSKDEAVQNIELGLRYLHQSAYQGYGPAYNALGDFYLSKEEPEKAFHYYQKSADFTFGPGQFNLGILYKNGTGTDRNPVKAYYYLSLASVNREDLHSVAQQAAIYRDEVVREVPPKIRQEILEVVSDLERPESQEVLPEKKSKKRLKNRR